MGLLSLFGDESSAYKKQMKQFAKAYAEAKGQLTPYGEAGQRGLANWEQGINKMQDPTAFYNNIMEEYEKSPGYQFQLDEAMNLLNNNAAANGLLNSDSLKQALLREGMKMLSLDRETFFNDIMGINNNYINQNSSLANLGYGADTHLANMAMDQGQRMGDATLASEQSRAQAMQKLFGTILNTAANAATGGMAGGMGGALSSVINPYTSVGGAQLSWLRNTGGNVPRETYRSSY